jgi:hypothetical protein
MGPPLLDDIWMRRGISLLWDAETLAAICTPRQVVSVFYSSMRQAGRMPTCHW